MISGSFDPDIGIPDFELDIQPDISSLYNIGIPDIEPDIDHDIDSLYTPI